MIAAIRIGLVGAAIVLLLSVACGDDDNGNGSSHSPTPTPTADVGSLPILDPWEIHIAASDGSGDKTVFSTGTGDVRYALSPNGTEVAVAESNYMSTTVHFLALDGTQRASVAHDGSAGELSWSPDGKYVISKFYKSGADSIVAIPVDASAPLDLVAPAPSATHPTSILPSGWLPTGELLVEQSIGGSGQTDLLAINAETAVSRKLADLNVWTDSFGVPQLSPDKTKLAVWVSAGSINDPACNGLTASTSIWTIDLGSGLTSRLTPESYCGSGGMVWSPDGGQLAFSVLLGRDSSYLYTVDAATGQTKELATGLDDVEAWNSAGQIVAEKLSCVSCEGGGDPIAVLIDTSTGVQQELATAAPNAVAPSGDTLVVADDGVRRIDLSGQLVAGLAPAADGWRYGSLSWTADEAHVAYVRFHKQGSRFFEVNRDGSGFDTKLFFANDGTAGSPLALRMSPDGKRIAYWVTPEGKTADLYVADADSSNAQRVDVTGSVGMFAWSPDSSRILFVAVDTTQPDGGATFVVNADGSGLHKVTTEVGFDKGGGPIFWAPNSKLAVFPGAPMRVLNVDTGALTNVEPGTEKGVPTWSADSSKLLYPVFNSQSGSDILVSAIDGTGMTTIHGDNRVLGGLSVSPDGTKLAYQLASGDTGGLFVSNIDGTDEKLVLTGASLGAGGPVWSPDGQWLATVAAPDGGDGGVFVVRPDGSDARQLTHGSTVAGIVWASDERLRLMSFIGGLWHRGV
jgi:Tol biopolymer transport system component